jgi:drug/metabolite transporter (DMT)-like permease
MELWFWAAVIAAFLSGCANFIFKIAARRDYPASQFSFYGGIFSVIATAPLVWFFSSVSTMPVLAYLAALLAGMLGGFNNIGKVKALKYIDTTIYFPLFKLLSPFLAIIFGMVFFVERFTTVEWIGLLLGMFVPLMLITPSEHRRQNNLLFGLVFIGFTALFAASGSALSAFAIRAVGDVLSVLITMSFGIVLGSLVADLYLGGFSRVKTLFAPKNETTFIVLAILRSIFISVAVGLIIFAYGNGGSVGVVHTINSMYILIPIVLSIIFYGEHWNLQKVVAIILSVAALALLG